MLREVITTAQYPNQPKRRWFSGLDMDVFIWIENEGIVSYQITYDKPHAEKALAWSAENGFTHHGVDDGSSSGKYPGSPLLVADGFLNVPRLVYKLYKNFGDNAPEVKDFIVSGLIRGYDGVQRIQNKIK